MTTEGDIKLGMYQFHQFFIKTFFVKAKVKVKFWVLAPNAWISDAQKTLVKQHLVMMLVDGAGVKASLPDYSTHRADGLQHCIVTPSTE